MASAVVGTNVILALSENLDFPGDVVAGVAAGVAGSLSQDFL